MKLLNRLFWALFVLGFVVLEINAEKRNKLMLISLDGLRADKLDEFLKETPESNLNNLVKNGVKAKYMQPSFPSQTFPNHWTLVTGLNVESHGIVSNTIYYPEYNEKIKLSHNFETKYWNYSEPIWMTASKQGLKTGASFWLGSEVKRRRPDLFLTFSEKFDTHERMEILTTWFKKFDLDIACVYFNEPDVTGHKLGPETKEYKNMIVEMDKEIGYLLKLLKEAEVLERLNIIIVSDHGMTTMKPDEKIYIQNYVDVNEIDLNKSVFRILSNIYPKSMDLIDKVYNDLLKIPNLKVYKKDEVPAEFFYRNNKRIGKIGVENILKRDQLKYLYLFKKAPIVAIAEEGYRLTYGDDPSVSKGHHGYNNSISSMRAVFMANGPDFLGSKELEPFRNVNVYPLMCKLLDIKCNPNNGTAEIFDQVLKPKKNFNIALNKFVDPRDIAQN